MKAASQKCKRNAVCQHLGGPREARGLDPVLCRASPVSETSSSAQQHSTETRVVEEVVEEVWQQAGTALSHQVCTWAAETQGEAGSGQLVWLNRTAEGTWAGGEAQRALERVAFLLCLLGH